MEVRMDKLLNARQAAERLGVTPSLIRRYCLQGRLGTKVGYQWIITEEELEAFEKIPRPVGKPRALVEGE
jgi:predicted site-specific integrase-resolvase